MAYKLLVADDSITIQRVVELTFADEDVQVIAVSDGQQAIARIESDRPDIVLVDAEMPERTGYEVASFVKTTPHLAHIPVVLLTTRFELDDPRARAAGCDRVLPKPFEPQVLVKRVHELLGVGSPPPAVKETETSPAVDETAAADTIWDISRSDRPTLALPPPAMSRAEPGDAPASQPIAVERERSLSETPGADEVAQRATLDEMFARRTTPADRQPPVVADLEDYFDRLDAAFSGPAAREAGATVPGGAAADARFEPSAVEQTAPRGGAAPAAGAGSPPPSTTPAPADSPSTLADVFVTLLAEEQGEVQRMAPSPRVAGPNQDLVEQVTRQVIARLADDSIREIVREVVRTVASQLVREEMDRLRAKADS